MLKTKSILEPIRETDGLRISIMSRHKWDPKIVSYTDINSISSEMFDYWFKDLAPSDILIGDYYKRNLPWEVFSERYLSEIKKDTKEDKVRKLANMALSDTVTILCLEKSPEKCHRKLLAKEYQIYQPKLDLNIK